MKNELRVGILGFGFIGKVHAFGYRTFPFYYPDLPPVRLTAVCTSKQETADAAKVRFGFDHAVTDFRQVTEAPDVDIVHVATPNALHKEALLSAMAAGKHIYCEKPLAASAEEAHAIRAALADYSGTAQMVLHNRFSPASLKAKELMDSGFVGDVLSFRTAYLHAGSADPEAPLKWKLSKTAAGGGVLFDLGSHIIDLTQHLIGDFTEVDCRTKIAYKDRPSTDGQGRVPVEAEDLALITASTAGGALGTVEASKIATGAMDEVRYEIHGSAGGLRFNSMRANFLEVYSREKTQSDSGWKALDTCNIYPDPAAKFPGPKFPPGWIRMHVGCLANFLQAVAEGRPGEPSLETGVRLQEIMDACYRSAEARAPVSV